MNLLHRSAGGISLLSLRSLFGRPGRRFQLQLCSAAGVYPAIGIGGGGLLPPETNLLLTRSEGPSTPPPLTGDDQLTSTAHANLLLQHETEGIHNTVNK